MINSPSLSDLLALSIEEKVKRYDAMVRSTFSHVDGRDLLDELHPRKQLDIKRRIDGMETWFEADWLSRLRDERNGGYGWEIPFIDSPPIEASDFSASSKAPERGESI